MALEAVLRALLDAVVVPDLPTALATANALQAAKAGAARLVAATDSAPDDATAELPPPPDLPGEPLLPHLKAPAPLQPLLRRLLGTVWVTDAPSLLAALPLPDAQPPHAAPPPLAASPWTYVTPDGLVLRPAAATVELWSPKAGESNPMELEHQLAEWQEDLARLQQDAANASARVADLQAAEAAAQQETATANATLADHRRELALAEGELRMVDREARQARQRVQTIAWELDALEKKTASGTARRAELSTSLESLRARLAENHARTDAATSALRDLDEKRTALVDAATDARVALSSSQQHREALRARANPLAARIRELETLIRDRAAGVDAYRTRIASLRQAADDATSRLAALQNNADSRKADLDAARARREKLTADLAARDALLARERSDLDAARAQRADADMAIARHSLQRQNLLDRLAADYQAAPEDALAAPEPEWPADLSPAPPSPATLETLVSGLRARLSEMGPVNLVAIEENQQLEERYAFLNQQNDDLVKAKTQLVDLIRKINNTTTSLFKDTFEKVNANFQTLFRQLFNGGSAKLVLVDEENVLESGIDILARPPGKKPQSVSLLSGGERTLTALSLLFALFRVKPSAFCLTDELDAALDDSNIARYLSMLDDFLKDTQFLVITHNRQTIAKASAIYGVTMEKRGISKFVSMKFRDDLPPPADPLAGTPAAPLRSPRSSSPVLHGGH